MSTTINSMFARWGLRRIGTIQGEEHLPKQGPFILVSNHQSYLEPLLYAMLVMRHTHQLTQSLTKHAVWKLFASIGLAKRLGMIPVHPKNRAASLAVARRALQQNNIIVIFPEGTRNTPFATTLLKGKTGAARLALIEGVPVIPAGYIAPEGRGTWKSIINFLSNGKSIHLNIGNAMTFTKIPEELITHELLTDTTTKIMRAIAELCHKSYPY